MSKWSPEEFERLCLECWEISAMVNKTLEMTRGDRLGGVYADIPYPSRVVENGRFQFRWKSKDSEYTADPVASLVEERARLLGILETLKGKIYEMAAGTAKLLAEAKAKTERRDR